MPTGEELYPQTSVIDRVARDQQVRLFQKPRVPPVPSLATASFQLGDGSTAASVTVTWTPVRKDIDYIVRWKKSTDSNYTYERARTSPHMVRPVETNVTINVALAAEYRTTGARSGFSADTNVTSAQDTTAPATPTGLAASVSAGLGTIKLSWTPNTEADLAFYLIARGTSTDPTGEYARVQASAYEDVNATVGTLYHYRLRAVDRAGNTSGYSSDVSATVAFQGPISSASITSGITDPGAAFTTLITQSITIPVGSKRLTAQVNVTAVSLVGGAGTVRIRFSIASAGSNSSGTADLAFTSAGQILSSTLKSSGDLSVSGVQNILYEWLDVEGDASTFQLSSPGSLQVTVT